MFTLILKSSINVYEEHRSSDVDYISLLVQIIGVSLSEPHTSEKYVRSTMHDKLQAKMTFLKMPQNNVRLTRP